MTTTATDENAATTPKYENEEKREGRRDAARRLLVLGRGTSAHGGQVFGGPTSFRLRRRHQHAVKTEQRRAKP